MTPEDLRKAGLENVGKKWPKTAWEPRRGSSGSGPQNGGCGFFARGPRFLSGAGLKFRDLSAVPPSILSRK